MRHEIEELCLLLIYLMGWEEDSRNEPEAKTYKCWKGFSFEILAELEEQEWIIQTGCTKLLVLTDKGKQLAQELIGKYINPKAERNDL